MSDIESILERSFFVNKVKPQKLGGGLGLPLTTALKQLKLSKPKETFFEVYVYKDQQGRPYIILKPLL